MAISKRLHNRHEIENRVYRAKREYQRKQREEQIRKYKEICLSELYTIKKDGEK